MMLEKKYPIREVSTLSKPNALKARMDWDVKHGCEKTGAIIVAAEGSCV